MQKNKVFHFCFVFFFLKYLKLTSIYNKFKEFFFKYLIVFNGFQNRYIELQELVF